MKKISLGCGLISIGRKWATHNEPLNEKESHDFLKEACRLGINLFDTAPSYGNSEFKLGNFLSNLESTSRDEIKIATKFGEHWDSKSNQPYVDHSFDACRKSIDNSIKLLNKIDILQLHKASPELLQGKDFRKIIAYAQSKRIAEFGVSVTDFKSTAIACSLEAINWIQIPFNVDWLDQEKSLDYAISKDKKIIINRPFNSGKLLGKDKKVEDVINRSLNLVLEKDFSGYILTGTRNIDHLTQNIALFNKLVNKYE